MKPDPDDAQYYEEEITEVRPMEDSGFTLGSGAGFINMENPDGLPLPNVGDTVRFYGKGFGYPVRGLVVGAHVYRYCTAEEQEREHKKWVEEQQEERRQSLHLRRLHGR